MAGKTEGAVVLDVQLLAAVLMEPEQSALLRAARDRDRVRFRVRLKVRFRFSVKFRNLHNSVSDK